MSNRSGTFATMEGRRAAFMRDHGYSEVPTEPVCSYVHPILDHGFAAKCSRTGRLVIFGDPYIGTCKIEHLEWIESHGFEVHSHYGIWYPEHTVLFEFRVRDRARALDFIRSGQFFVARQPGRFAPPSEPVRHGSTVVRWLPVGASNLKRKERGAHR